MGQASNRKWAKRAVRVTKARTVADRLHLFGLFGRRRKFRRALMELFR